MKKLIAVILMTSTSFAAFANPVKLGSAVNAPPEYSLISTHKSIYQNHALEFQMPSGQGVGVLALANVNCALRQYGNFISFNVTSYNKGDRGLCDNLQADALSNGDTDYIAAMIEQVSPDCPVKIKINSSTLAVIEIEPTCHVSFDPIETSPTVIIHK